MLLCDKPRLSHITTKRQDVIARQKKREEAVTPSHPIRKRRAILRGGIAQEASAAL
jgi:hypothetical protein